MFRGGNPPIPWSLASTPEPAPPEPDGSCPVWRQSLQGQVPRGTLGTGSPQYRLVDRLDQIDVPPQQIVDQAAEIDTLVAHPRPQPGRNL
jgi:hypothetical protein